MYSDIFKYWKELVIFLGEIGMYKSLIFWLVDK